MSRCAGMLAGVHIPHFLRSTLYNFFCKKYKVNTSEIKLPISEFATFKEFFTRELKDNSRPFHEPGNNEIICSPADSTVLSFGEITDDTTFYVKGRIYPVEEFLYGLKPKLKMWKTLFPSLNIDPNQTLYYAILYLSPSDFHRYFCPTSLLLKQRQYIVGPLYPVMPSYLEKQKRTVFFNSIIACIERK